MVYRISGTAFRVHFIYLQKEISLEMTKRWNNHNQNDDTCQGVFNSLFGVWSHDQLPKMVKI
jgi:hypothetical protein